MHSSEGCCDPGYVKTRGTCILSDVSSLTVNSVAHEEEREALPFPAGGLESTPSILLGSEWTTENNHAGPPMTCTLRSIF